MEGRQQMLIIPNSVTSIGLTEKIHLVFILTLEPKISSIHCIIVVSRLIGRISNFKEFLEMHRMLRQKALAAITIKTTISIALLEKAS